jgi:ribosome biogenesis GTPase
LSDDGEESRYDESDVRVRPNRKGTRPRTKNRPAHEAAVDGMVIAVDRGRYTVLVDPDGPSRHAVTATRARELGKDALVTGDRVALVGDTTGDDG